MVRDRRAAPPARQGAIAHRLIAVFFLALLVACAPKVQAPGALVEPPRLAADHWITADGQRLPVKAFRAQKPDAILIGTHGMNDYSNAFSLPGPWFAANGISLYAYDQRGFGGSPTPGVWPADGILARDLRDFVYLVAQEHPFVPIYLLGDSMGGAVVMTTLDGTTPNPVKGAILVAPAVWGWSNLNVLYKTTLWLSAHVWPSKLLTGERLDVWPSDNIEMLRDLGRDPKVIKKTRIDAIYGLVTLMDGAFAAADRLELPVLMLYGAKDEVIPGKAIDQTLKQMDCSTRFVRYPNGYHMLLRDNQREVVWQDILAWIDDKRAVLPSGAEEPLPTGRCADAKREVRLP